MTTLGPTLETERLILKPPAEADWDPYAAMMADEEAARYIGGVKSRELAWRALATMAGCWSLRGFGMFSVFRKADGVWIGLMGPWRPGSWPGNEIGWTLAREAWGRGYAAEAVGAAMDWAFESLPWTEVIHCIHPDNHASIRLAERLGSTLKGPVALPEPYAGTPSVCYGQTKAAWTARRAAP